MLRPAPDNQPRQRVGPGLFSYLTDLRANNNREWFAANKHRYEEQLLDPALDFINAFGPRLEKISPHFRADARASGGSLLRIYRDTRFAKDKSPYKTNVGIHFRHERAKDAHAPGYYLHIGPGEVFAGGGIWHPGTDAATAIREAIVTDPERWRRTTRVRRQSRRHGGRGGDRRATLRRYRFPRPEAGDRRARNRMCSSVRR
jgi:uncharacterized protein (TIGR02453 family)